MKSNITIVSLLSLSVQLGAMDDSTWAGFTKPKNDGSFPDDTYVRGDTLGERVKETFNSYYCPFDDTQPTRLIKPGIFAQFCVQASKATSLDPHPFQELLGKIKSGTINSNAEIIRMTEKDLQYRLLSYIPTGKVHALMNDKKVRIMFMGVAKSVIKKEESVDLFPDIVPHFREGRSYAGGRAPELTGELELTVDYNFESDVAHHAAVMAAFKALIKDAY